MTQTTRDTATCRCGDTRWKLTHYRSDFAFSAQLRGCPDPVTGEPGAPVDISGCGFTMEVRPKGSPTRIVLSRKGDALSPGLSLMPDGSIHCACDNHGLPPGKVYCRITVEFPDAAFPDGFRRQVWEFPTGIELSAAATCPGDGEALVSVVVPLLGMEEITRDEVAEMFEQLEGSPLSALRPATGAEIQAVFNPQAAIDITDDNLTAPQEGAQP